MWTPNVVENNRAKILWDFRLQTDKQLPATIVVFDKAQTTAVVIGVAIPTSGRRSMGRSRSTKA